MSWWNHWNRRLEGWVERRRRFRKMSAGKMQDVAGARVLAPSRPTVPNRVLDPREAR